MRGEYVREKEKRMHEWPQTMEARKNVGGASRLQLPNIAMGGMKIYYYYYLSY